MKFKFDRYVLDTEARFISFRNQSIDLTPKLYSLLMLFIESEGRVVSRQDIHDHLWPGRFVTEDTLYQLVARLRNCLKTQKSCKIIENIHGVGYRFTAEIKSYHSKVIPMMLKRFLWGVFFVCVLI